MNAVELLSELSLLGVRAISPEPGRIKLVAITGKVPTEAIELAQAGKPELVEHFLRSAVRCPACGGRNLVDDPVGIACDDCHDIAFIEIDGSLVRMDFVGSSLWEIDPDEVPVCDRCGRFCDVQTINDAWHCSACDSAADDRRQRTESLLRHVAAIKRYNSKRHG